MDQQKTARISFRKVLIAVSAAIVSMVVLLLLGAFLLQRIERFERFYSAFCYGIFCIEAILLCVLSRESGAPPATFALISSGVTSLICFAVGLIVGSGKTDLLGTGIRYLFFIALSVGLTLLPLQKTGHRTALKRKRRR